MRKGRLTATITNMAPAQMPVDPDAFNRFEAAAWEQRPDGYHRFLAPIRAAFERLVRPWARNGGLELPVSVRLASEPRAPRREAQGTERHGAHTYRRRRARLEVT